MSGQVDDDDLPDVEQEARQMGWVPEDEFKGNKDHWIGAEEYVERGRKVMPILLSNNKRLQTQLKAQSDKLSALETALQASTRAMEKLEGHYTEANKRAVETARQNLINEMKQAREDNDVEGELAARDKLDELKKSTDDLSSKQKDPPKKEEPKSVLSDEFVSWQNDNPWFSGTSKEDKQKTKEVVRIAEDLREEGSELTGREFMEECVRILEKRNKPEPRTSKVEAAPNRRENGGGGSSGGGKTFADLPADAKAQCLEDAADFVGEGMRYKTLDEWKKRYVSIYFTE